MGKGEVACDEQFLLFPQCFQKTCTAHLKTRACLEKVKRLNSTGNILKLLVYRIYIEAN